MFTGVVATVYIYITVLTINTLLIHAEPLTPSLVPLCIDATWSFGWEFDRNQDEEFSSIEGLQAL